MLGYVCADTAVDKDEIEPSTQDGAFIGKTMQSQYTPFDVGLRTWFLFV